MVGIDYVLYKRGYMAAMEIKHFRKSKPTPNQCYKSAIWGP